MTLLTNIENQIIVDSNGKSAVYKFARGPQGFAICSQEGQHVDLGVEVNTDDTMPSDAGMIRRYDRDVRWFGRSEYYLNFGIPEVGERRETVSLAQVRFPSFNHMGDDFTAKSKRG